MAFPLFPYPPRPRQVLVAQVVVPSRPAVPVDTIDLNAFLASIPVSRWYENNYLSDIDRFLQQGPVPFQLVRQFHFPTPFGQRSLEVWRRGRDLVCIKEPLPEMLVLRCYLQATRGTLKAFFGRLSGDPLPTAEEYDLIEDFELVTGADLYRSAQEIAVDNGVLEWSGQRVKLVLDSCSEILCPSAVLWTRHAATRLVGPLRRCVGKVNGFQRRLDAFIKYLQDLRSDELRYLYPSSAAELDFILDQILGL